MEPRNKGVTFIFDESILAENRKLNVPLNIAKNEFNLTSIFGKHLVNLNRSYKILNLNSINRHELNLSSLTVNTWSNNRIKEYAESGHGCDDSNKYKTGYPDTKNIEKLIENNISKSKNVYNTLISETLNELENLERIENELKERKRREKLEHEQKLKEELEKKKHLEEERESEKLKNEQKQIENKSGVSLITGNGISNDANGKLDGYDYIPKNNSVKLYEDINSDFKELEKAYNEIKLNSALKTTRIAISRRITACLNSLANTQKQIELIFNKLMQIFNEFPEMKVFIVFKVIEGILNCCEEGCQIYINNKSAWSFSRLLQRFVDLDQTFGVVYYKLISQKCTFAIPRFYISKSHTSSGSTNSISGSSIGVRGGDTNSSIVNSDMASLCKIHEYELDNNSKDIRYNKRLTSFLTLHFSFFVVKNDFKSVWSFYSNVVNSSWENILLPVVPNILITLLNTTSYFMLSIYKIQFNKILMNIFQLMNERLSRMSYTSSFQMYLGQIEQFYQQYNSKGQIDMPEGYNMKYKEEELRRDV